MSTLSSPKVSVVVNTCNRAKYLGDTLDGLKQQTYDNFEVVIVNGPSEDNTEEVAKRYNVRYFTAPFNISVSRNVGIKNSSGDIIAFIDDDAVPEPNWLQDIVVAYGDPKVGAAGGLVYNRDGDGFQSCYSAVSYWGYIKHSFDKPQVHNKKNGLYYNVNIGTNASFRRTHLIKVGGFDEEIEYYHDESDVCVRLINAGYKVVQLDNAFVHHKMAPSFRRDNKKQFTNWDSTVKNTIYFGVKNSQGLAPLHKRIFTFLPVELPKFWGMFKMFRHRQYTLGQFFQRSFSLIRAFYRGYKRGFFQNRKLLKDYKYSPENFKKYKTVITKVQDIVLVSQGFPPVSTDGIARYSSTLAASLADSGHRVYVITKGRDNKPGIRYQNKYWVYSYSNTEFLEDITGYNRVDKIIAASKSVYITAKGIHKKIPINVIVAPLWDVEGLTLLRSRIAPVILTLMSPLKKVVETQWYYLDDPSFELVYDLEKYCINNADGIMSISEAIKDTIVDLYGIDWAKTKASDASNKVIPLGVEDSIVRKARQTKVGKLDEKFIKILFVGRFERRKGIDVLLAALEKILPHNPEVKIELVGNSNIMDENGKFVYKEFEKKNKKKEWFNRMTKYGYVSDKKLTELYADCDIFVAPSRYESFGLIFIEAMAAGKPVIGAKVGGIPEIIVDGKNGLLFENENIDDLVSKLDKLIKDKKLRLQMGVKGQQILAQKFSSGKMTENFLDLVRNVTTEQ